MKLRSGFVSNSSSSSFVVAFPIGFRPSIEAIKAYLFPGRTALATSFYNADLPIDEAAARILAQMRGKRPNSATAIKGALSGGWISGMPDYNSAAFRKAGDRDIDWTAWTKAADAFRAAWWRKQKALIGPGHDLYVFWFADEDGVEGAILEHGNTFAAAPHATISHH
jgi:hypothetical protein